MEIKTIYKYPLLMPTEIHEIPIGAEFLSCGMQNDEFCMWFLVDAIKEKEKRTFTCIPTGYPYKYIEGYKYSLIGRADYNNGLVYHIFEVIEEK